MNFNSFTKVVLLDVCKSLNIGSVSKKRKQDIISKIEKHDENEVRNALTEATSDKETKPLFSKKVKISRNPSRGSNCSVKGKEYELKIHDIVKRCKLGDQFFNTQTATELGGCSAVNDIECNLLSERDVSIEIKKSKTPDWMQCSLTYDKTQQKWIGSANAKIPVESRELFERLISDVSLFNGKIPPFMEKPMTHAEWIKEKESTKDFSDAYIDCPSDTISSLYSAKGCSYIQVSDKGLYHLGDDKCKFGVPQFEASQQLRVRTKIHTRKNSKGFCSLSVVVACQPKNINELVDSSCSLDDVSKLPDILSYCK
jgi:hypothetical protein